MKPKIYLLSLGCPRNLVDSEVILGGLRNKGLSVTNSAEYADTFIVNTCAFIEKAKMESIDTILELAAMKNKRRERGLAGTLIVAGCLPQRYASDLRKEIPEIDGIFGTADFSKISGFILNAVKKKLIKVKRTPDFLYDHKSQRKLITPSHYAYVKVQEGCMNNCSYCVIPKLRGPYRSRSFDSVMNEIKTLVTNPGVREINFIGQDTTLYGIDRYGGVRIAQLLDKAADIVGEGWIRLLYTHPAHFNDDLIEIIRGKKAICKYVDLPIQHINDLLLKKMNRGVSKRDIILLIEKIRKKIPEVGIRTTVIVGFPGETEKMFGELVAFIKDMRFERLGAFVYSREEGTKAFAYRKQISEKEKDIRYNAILTVQQEIALRNNTLLHGKIKRVLIDEKAGQEEDLYCGRTEMDAPEVDGICYVRSNRRLKRGSFVNVRITDTLEYDLVGEIV